MKDAEDGRVHVKREDWDPTKFPNIHFYRDENKWCPLCNGRTVERDGSFCHLLFFSFDYLWDKTKRLLKSARGEIEVKIEEVRDILRLYFQDKFHAESGVADFDSFQRQDDVICWHCLQKAKSELKAQIEDFGFEKLSL